MTQDAKVVQAKFNKAAYYKAQGYAYKLQKKDYVDIVHDAYVVWFNKTNKSLFDEPSGVIARVIKNIFWNSLNRRLWMYEGVFHSKTFYSIDEFPEQVFIPTSVAETPLSILITKDMHNQLGHNLKPRELQVLQHLKDGYKQIEISKILGISANNVNIRAKKIYKRLEEVTEVG